MLRLVWVDRLDFLLSSWVTHFPSYFWGFEVDCKLSVAWDWFLMLNIFYAPKNLLDYTSEHFPKETFRHSKPACKQTSWPKHWERRVESLLTRFVSEYWSIHMHSWFHVETSSKTFLPPKDSWPYILTVLAQQARKRSYEASSTSPCSLWTKFSPWLTGADSVVLLLPAFLREITEAVLTAARGDSGFL